MPSFPMDDENLRTRWEETCNLCSRSLMELLIGNNKNGLEKLDRDIEDTRKKLTDNLTSVEMETLNKDIEAQFPVWEKEVKETKTKKFQRDLEDFKSGTVYRWQSNKSNGEGSISRTSSLSSISSRENDNMPTNCIYNLRKNINKRRNDNYKRRDKWADNPGNARLQVINLSDKQLTEPQVEVLSLGLTFSPSSSFDSFLAVKDLNLFARKLVLKKLHSRSDKGMEWTEKELEAIATLEELSGERDETAEKGKFIPPKPKKFPSMNLYPNIDLFVKLVSKEFGEIPNKITRDNLSIEQRRALKELKSMRDIVIKPADKGGNIIIQSTRMYEREAFRQLRDSSCYKRLTYNPTLSFQSELQEILERAFQEGVISKELRTHLIPIYPKTACIYFTPKIHKNMTAPPGRPIVSGNGSLCEAENLSKRFYDRGYSRRSIKRGLHKATRMERPTLMNPKMKPPTEQKFLAPEQSYYLMS
ncbi:uncharacterized protein LOC143785876 [Ranitomeya variabilis]|uniref:uncharacterized protein LOC143785876 n=1 Tax=Ranitomeya variabilis TaxID=490064 RepID=UPI004056B0F3